MGFKVGQCVKWTSSSNGSTTTKVGEIVQVVPPKARFDREHTEYGLEGYGLPRDHETYIVHVPGKTSRAKGKRYWPHVAAMTAA